MRATAGFNVVDHIELAVGRRRYREGRNEAWGYIKEDLCDRLELPRSQALESDSSFEEWTSTDTIPYSGGARSNVRRVDDTNAGRHWRVQGTGEGTRWSEGSG